ncbi:uncharacterized protein LOC114004809 [Tupaia chinensis]|uniref:uncharacterized protein LOC114004809 n=1 Tax=Tupaia chinensis TaxID=246437 RepID=UPI000FFB5974|nr:uncharacterized protein LOC114004809 [Tupaia chinensis]
MNAFSSDSLGRGLGLAARLRKSVKSNLQETALGEECPGQRSGPKRVRAGTRASGRPGRERDRTVRREFRVPLAECGRQRGRRGTRVAAELRLAASGPSWARATGAGRSRVDAAPEQGAFRTRRQSPRDGRQLLRPGLPDLRPPTATAAPGWDPGQPGRGRRTGRHLAAVLFLRELSRRHTTLPLVNQRNAHARPLPWRRLSAVLTPYICRGGGSPRCSRPASAVEEVLRSAPDSVRAQPGGTGSKSAHSAGSRMADPGFRSLGLPEHSLGVCSPKP